MKSTISFSSSLTVICLLATSQAHTWLENLRLIGSNGIFTGKEGYARGHVSRTDPKFNGDNMVYLLDGPEPLDKNTPMCRETQQSPANQAPNFPALSAAPGDNIALRYLENGHVTKLEPGRPARGGMVFIYGTKEPKTGEKLNDVHRVWNTAGTGGDKRGKLIATRPYDDGQCYQIVGTELSVQRQKANPLDPGISDLACQTDIQIPADAGTSGLYTIYWVWDWPTIGDGKVTGPQMYTQCADINLVSQKVADVGPLDLPGKIDNTFGIPEQMKNQFMINPSDKPAMTTAPPFSMDPGPSSAAPVAPPPSKQTPTAPPPSSTPVKVSPVPSTTTVKSSTPAPAPAIPSSSTKTPITTAIPSSSTPKPITTSAPASSFPSSQSFITVTVTTTPEEQKAPSTVTEYITIGSTPLSSTTTIRKTATAPLPTNSIIEPSSTPQPAKPEPTPTDGGRPVVEPIFSQSPSPSPSAKPSTPGGVFREPNASSRTTSDAVVHTSASTTSNAVLPTPPVNGTVPILGRHVRKRVHRHARW